MKLKLLLTTFVLLFLFSFAGEAQAGTLGRPANNLGLVGYWSFNEGTSTLAGDSSGRGNTGTLSGSTLPAWVDGKLGRGLSFDGSTSYIQTSTFQSQSLAKTICAWVKPAQQSGLRGLVIQENGFYLRLNSMQLEARVYNSAGGTSNTYNSTGTLVANQWSFICETVDATTGGAIQLAYYINGTLDSTRATDTTGPNAGASGLNFMKVGNDDDSAGRFFSGSIDDVRVYTRVLTAAQVSALYNAGGTRVNSSQTAVTDGLVGRWTFDGGDVNWTSATAGVAYDRSGSNNTGTLTSMNRSTASVIGKVGQALNFDGSSAYVSLPTAAILDGATRATVSAWVKPSSGYTSTYRAIFYTSSSAGSNNFLLQTNTGDGELRFYIAGFLCQTVGNPLVANQWTLVTATLDGTAMNMYANGVLVKNCPGTATVTDSGVAKNIGRYEGGSQYFPGAIDDVRLYNRALTAAEVKQIYNEGAGTKTNTSTQTLQGSSLASGLVGLWTFDGKDMYQNVADTSGSANHGSLQGQTSTTTIIGKLGQALQFDGTDDYVEISDSSSLDTTNFTLSAWVKYDAIDVYDMILTKSNVNGAGSNAFELRVDGSAGTWELVSDGGAVLVNSITPPTTGSWFYVVATRDTNGTAIYVNGVQEDTGAAGTFTQNDNSVFIGRRDDSSSVRMMDGIIDDVRIYNRALTAAEVKQLYDMGK